MIDDAHSMPPSVRRAFSAAPDPLTAAADLHRALSRPGLSLVLFFCSAEYEEPSFAAELTRLFNGVLVVGCTGAGEIGPGGYHDNTVTAVSFARPDFEAVAALLVEGGGIDLGRCGATIADLRHELDHRLERWPADASRFALLLVDSTTRREEEVASLVGSTLADLPVLGGSAGDALAFERTSIFYDGRFRPEGAVLLLVATSRPVQTFRSQHFVASDRKMVVTGAAPERRLVTELDAEPAVEVYARLVGCPVAELTPMVFATHPLVVRLGGAEYVRSIQKANPDGSLSFYCAIDEGLVLTLSEGHDLLSRVEGLFADVRARLGTPEVVIGFECVLNRLEAERSQIKHRLSRLYDANNVTGFASFGEQWGSMHVNQTFTGIAIGRAAKP
jgi:hypothetical protein